MNLKTGDRIWLPCEVKPGPFSNERLVRIRPPSGPWIGFVETSSLKDPIEEGETCVLALVIKIEQDSITAIVQGHAFNTRQIHTSAAEVSPVVPIPA